MFEESEVEDNEAASPDDQPEVRISGEMGDEASYAPSIMLFAETSGEAAEDERRREARRAYDVAVYVHHDGEEFVGLCGDVSEGGLFVATHDAPPKGSLIELEFLMPDSDEEFRLEAEVRWVRKEWDEEARVAPGFGVRFIDLSDKDRARLDRVLEATK